MTFEKFCSILQEAVQSGEWVAYFHGHEPIAIRLSQWDPSFEVPTWKQAFSPLESFNMFCPITAVESILHDRVVSINEVFQCKTTVDLDANASWVVTAADDSDPTLQTDPGKFTLFRKGLIEACGLDA